ncbi:hypothetical protein NIES4071_106170 (plasmid) [Calothrix sp. NIES-4071]|nr:hypothetical protein NIES4071_106170 [Calothrix sp. NIES-4071]BAZ65035.1 hypothetical protein NIES4105_107680 [Calothrix sp. NIES-4105]
MTIRYFKESIKIKNHCTGRFKELLEKCFIYIKNEPEHPEWGLLGAIFYPDSIEYELHTYEAALKKLNKELDIWLSFVRARDVLEGRRRRALTKNNLEDKIIYLELQRIIS